jgi:cytochrome c oxidase subunit II
MKVQSDLKFGHRRLLEVDRPLVIPVETPLRMLVTSMDVIHSWAVPSLGIKIDAIPGKLNQFWLYAPYQGVFLGQCSELCGANHGFMPINVYVVTPENYLKWYFKISQDGREDQIKKLAQIIMSRKITPVSADPFIEQKEINSLEDHKKD